MVKQGASIASPLSNSHTIVQLNIFWEESFTALKRTNRKSTYGWNGYEIKSKARNPALHILSIEKVFVIKSRFFDSPNCRGCIYKGGSYCWGQCSLNVWKKDRDYWFLLNAYEVKKRFSKSAIAEPKTIIIMGTLLEERFFRFGNSPRILELMLFGLLASRSLYN